MEIVYFEKVTPPNVMHIILLIWGVVCLGVGFGTLIYSLIKEIDIDWKFVALELVCGTILFSINLAEVLYTKEEKIVYARIDDTVPYVEMIEKYEFIDKEDNLYKLKELSP